MKKYRINLFVAGLFFLLFGFSSFAQKLDSTLAVYADKYSQERSYIHFDKASYFSGETIWFKAYVMDGILPADSSKTFYADWVDGDGKVIYHSVCPVIEATASGHFDIPGTYTGNAVYVRAYTKWMLNFDTGFLYNKTIPVLSKKSPLFNAKNTIIASLQFFPEGGDLISGIPNKVAFKSVDQWGRPVPVKGTIMANNNATDSFRSVHNGMGYLVLTPQPGVTYTAKWKDVKGAEHITPLPVARPAGAAMQIVVAANKRLFSITRTSAAADNIKTLHLVGTIYHHLVFKAEVNLTDRETANGAIPTDNLPSGLLTITLFDAAWNAIAERITFVDNGEYKFTTAMEVQHWGLNKRAKNEIQITVPDSLMGNLSMAVTDAGIETDSSNHIISHLLLTSELKGAVYNPAYYFSGANKNIPQQLDLVMLTNGWRRFKWEDVTRGKFPVIHYPKDTSYLTLSGKVYGVPAAQLREGGDLVIIVKQKDSTSKMVVAPVNSNGLFSDPEFIFFDTLHVFYQFQKSKALNSAEVRFMYSRLPPPVYNANAFLPFMDTTGFYRHMLLAQEKIKAEELLKGKTLQNVTVQAKTKSNLSILDDKYTSGLFKGSDSYQFDLTNDPSASASISIFNYLQGKVAGLQITTSGSGASLQWRGSTPQLYLDEIPADVNMVGSISVSDVAYVKVFRPPFFGSFGGGAGGAIAIYTRKGGDQNTKNSKGLANAVIMGYTPIKEFYSPNYATFSSRNELTDVRTTLYWNPMIYFSPKKKIATVSFYNNDATKSFRVIIEGVTKDGQFTHLEQIME